MIHPANDPVQPGQLSPRALMNRAECAKLLSEAGFPTSRHTLASLASRGGGPPYRKYGRIVVYRWSDALNWAEARMGPFRNTASEGAYLDRQAACGLVE